MPKTNISPAAAVIKELEDYFECKADGYTIYPKWAITPEDEHVILTECRRHKNIISCEIGPRHVTIFGR